MIPTLSRLIRTGYVASRGGAPAESNPYPVASFVGHAWAIGWRIGDLPPVVRIVVAMVLL